MTETNDKGTFILRCSFFAQVKILTREQRGDLLTAIFAHASGDELPSMDDVTRMCFEFIKASIDSFTDKYNAKCLKNKENGSRGGRPRRIADGSQENQPESDETERFSNNRKGDNESERFSSDATESDGTERMKNNHEYDSDSDYDSDNELDNMSNQHTHTIFSNKGGVGENSAAALLAWVAVHYPDVAAMRVPLTEKQAAWLINHYDVEGIHSIIAAVDNKGATKNKHAFKTIYDFAKRDHTLCNQQELLTYDQVCNLTPRGGSWSDLFERIQVNGRPMWRRKNNQAK